MKEKTPFLKKLALSLPPELPLEKLCSSGDPLLWETMPEFAAAAALADGLFDAADYLARYPDVEAGMLDPVWHFIRYGINEKRSFRLMDSNDITGMEAKAEQKKTESSAKGEAGPAELQKREIERLREELALAHLRQKMLECEARSAYLANGASGDGQ